MINEVSAYTRSLISVGQVDIAYVVKKLNHFATQKIDLNELANFLADHLHFEYVGLVVNGRLYGSKMLAISASDLAIVSTLDAGDKGIWRKMTGDTKVILKNLGVTAVAELHDSEGRMFGQMLLGAPIGKRVTEKQDLLQLEMIINIVALTIDPAKHSKKRK